MRRLRALAKKAIHRAGYDLHRLSSNASYQLLLGLERFGVDLVLDVGANIGQFASELRSVGYGGAIVSFEPLSTAYGRLCANASDDAGWRVHLRCAIGDHDREITMNVAGNSVSSSVLPMLDAHASAAVGSAYVGAETVTMARLDSVAPSYLAGFCRPFLKVDTQGFEWQVLDGAREILPKVQGILCELSLVPLYEGQRLWTDMIRRLDAQGFTLWEIHQGFADPRDGRTLQVDGVFFRSVGEGSL